MSGPHDSHDGERAKREIETSRHAETRRRETTNRRTFLNGLAASGTLDAASSGRLVGGAAADSTEPTGE